MKKIVSRYARDIRSPRRFEPKFGRPMRVPIPESQEVLLVEIRDLLQQLLAAVRK